MLIKKIEKNNVVYYALCIYDKSTKKWASTLIKEKNALSLISNGVKYIEN